MGAGDQFHRVACDIPPLPGFLCAILPGQWGNKCRRDTHSFTEWQAILQARIEADRGDVSASAELENLLGTDLQGGGGRGKGVRGGEFDQARAKNTPMIQWQERETKRKERNDKKWETFLEIRRGSWRRTLLRAT